MRLRSTAVLMLLPALLLPLAAARAEDDPKAPVIEQILQETHVLDQIFSITNAFVAQIAPAFEKVNPTEGPKIRSILENEFKTELEGDRTTVEKGIVAVYEQNFELDELNELLAFYQSPLGQKLVQRQPAVMQQSMQVGAAWGQAAAQRAIPKAMDRMKAEGLKTDL